MNAKTFEQFSPRDQGELRNVLLELQKLEPPKNVGDDVDHYKFFLGRSKQFRITRIK